MSTPGQGVSRLNQLFVVALFGVILWYWVPYFTTEDMPEQKQVTGTIIVSPAEPLPEEPPAIPEETLAEAQKPPVKEISTEPEPEPPAEEAKAETEKQAVEPEEALTESSPEPPEPPDPPEPMVSESAPPDTQTPVPPAATSSASSEGVAIAGRVQDIWPLIDWLQQQGGTMWLDDGYQTLGNIYELTSDGTLVSVSEQQYRHAGSRYAPRSMSQANHQQVVQLLGYAVDSKRLLLMWPRHVWLNIQERIHRLGVDQIQLEYHIVDDELKLHIVKAVRQGVPVPDLQGLLP